MGPQHPATHGVLKVILELEGERLVKSTPVLGYLHRGVEKLAEDGTYHQFIPHTDRLDYICAMYNNFAYCRAVEKLMNITVPDRAEYLRTIVAEVQRIIGHQFWLGTQALDIGVANEPIQWVMERFDILVIKMDVVAALVAGLLVSVLAVFFNRTRIGRALRAVADDHQAALAVGIPLKQIWAIVWSVAGFVALVAGLMWGARSGVQFALTFTALKALPVLILGGFESIAGAIVGGLIIGAAEKLAGKVLELA
jgi:branched-subunit amino acid ABC-type transport system permease component